MSNQNFFSDNPEMQFFLKKRINWQDLFDWLSEEEKEAIGASNPQEYLNSWMEILDILGSMCGGPIAANAEAVDRSKYQWVGGKGLVPKELQKNCEMLKEFGIAGLGVDPKYGGMGAPFIFEAIAAELVNRACPSTMLNMGWYGSIAHILDTFASEEIKEEYICKIAQGIWSGNMALTEANAGSDLGALKTYGVKQEDGTWNLYGTKCFISNGTSQISLVLAKNEKGSEGLSALSLFLCPRENRGFENIKVLKLEEKLGLHGSATAELAYDGSTAWILGKEGEGFQYMLRLMNYARIGVGFQGLGLMEATFSLAKNYAEERMSWGKPLAKHELIAEQLLDMEVELIATRSLCYQAAFSISMMYLAERALKKSYLGPVEKQLLEKKLASYKQKVRKWTPLIKYWVGERSVMHARQCMQILGGYGYTTKYKAEWWVRESLIYSVYEGTSQIQALMCIKDTLKEVVRNPRQFIETVLGLKLKGLTSGSQLKSKLYKVKQAAHGAVLSLLAKLLKNNVKETLLTINDKEITHLIKALSRDLVKLENISPALLHAERVCEIKCLESLSESLVLDAEEDENRSWVAERFMYTALHRINHLKSRIEQDDEIIQQRISI
ncbi:MAG: acyl-CoA dehydrogenase family protein [Oligoflexales bacterium]